MTVLYVTGWCRSGSTLIANLLGELPGVVHVGELHYLWRNGVLGAGTNTSCGCGVPVRVCPLWSKVVDRVAGDSPEALARQAVADQRALLRTRHARARLAESLGQRRPGPRLGTVVDRMIRGYEAVVAETGARLVIDSSKYPAEPAALLARPEVDLRVLHLVRDPRASAYSWLRAKAYIPAMGVVRSSAYWTAANLASDRIGAAVPDRYLRLRHEDFVAEPQASLAAVLALCGLTDPPPVNGDREAMLGVNHTVTGNPDRLANGPVWIRPDNAWRSQLPTLPWLAATVLAAPLLRRYDYPFRR